MRVPEDLLQQIPRAVYARLPQQTCIKKYQKLGR
jgi:hypothetical protein